MALLQPRLCVLDETDSGLDIDALRVVADGVNTLRDAGRAFLVITHYQRLLDHIKPDVVHVMARGRIVKSGGAELALELERNGYRDYAERRPRHERCTRPFPRPPPRRRWRPRFRRSPPSDAAKAAFADFEKRGLPTRRDEAWHYTDLRAAMKRVQPLAAAPDDQRLKAAEAALAKTTRIAAVRLVLVDGRYVGKVVRRRAGGISLSLVEEPRAPDISDAVISLNRAFVAEALEAAGRRECRAAIARNTSSRWARRDLFARRPRAAAPAPS